MPELPEPNFLIIVQIHHLQAMLSLGAINNPMTGHPNPIDRKRAMHELALLEILKDKTQGNLEAEEENLLDGIIDSIRQALEAV